RWVTCAWLRWVWGSMVATCGIWLRRVWGSMMTATCGRHCRGGGWRWAWVATCWLRCVWRLLCGRLWMCCQIYRVWRALLGSWLVGGLWWWRVC
ncbi:unnamed protein product, partial [Effrenium voratum]